MILKEPQVVGLNMMLTGDVFEEKLGFALFYIDDEKFKLLKERLPEIFGKFEKEEDEEVILTEWGGKYDNYFEVGDYGEMLIVPEFPYRSGWGGIKLWGTVKKAEDDLIILIDDDGKETVIEIEDGVFTITSSSGGGVISGTLREIGFYPVKRGDE